MSFKTLLTVFILFTLPSHLYQAQNSLHADEAKAEKNQLQFKVYDLYIDAGTDSVSAWQVELKYNPNQSYIVGIEGGSEKGWKKAPYYDNKGFKSGRLVVAAFKTGKEYTLTEKKRIARIHVAINSGDNNDIPTVKLIDSANFDGVRIQPKLKLVRFGA